MRRGSKHWNAANGSIFHHPLLMIYDVIYTTWIYDLILGRFCGVIVDPFYLPWDSSPWSQNHDLIGIFLWWTFLRQTTEESLPPKLTAVDMYDSGDFHPEMVRSWRSTVLPNKMTVMKRATKTGMVASTPNLWHRSVSKTSNHHISLCRKEQFFFLVRLLGRKFRRCKSWDFSRNLFRCFHMFARSDGCWPSMVGRWL